MRRVAFFMLDKVSAPELIPITVDSCILPYAEDHDIPFDELLLQYIKVKTTQPTQILITFKLTCVFSWASDCSPGPARALQLSNHDTLHQMGSQSCGGARLHDWHWCKFCLKSVYDAFSRKLVGYSNSLLLQMVYLRFTCITSICIQNFPLNSTQMIHNKCFGCVAGLFNFISRLLFV